MNLKKTNSTMKHFSLALAFMTGLLSLSCQQPRESSATTDAQFDYLYENLPFEMNKVAYPVFPKNEVMISDFGGKGDGTTNNTKAFAEAFEALSQKGGGKLIVPAGVWYTGPIVFKSNINLYLDKSAIILFSSNFDDYPLVTTVFEGLDTKRCQSPISGTNLENIAITGQGTIDGSGHAWRPLKRGKVTESHWNKVLASGGVLKRDDYWFPSEKSLLGDKQADMNVPRNMNTDEDWLSVKDFLRPVMVSFIECKNLLLEGVLFQNSPSWNLHPLMCENVIINNVQVRNPSYAQNGDGLDLESCKNALIINSTFDVGDDGICIKSGKDADGRRRARPTENVIVDNCTVFKGHGGFVVGSEMSGGARNIVVRNCQFLGTDVGLRFKSRRGRGGVVENIYVSNVTMVDIVTDSFLFDLYYGGKSASEVLADGDETPIETSIPEVNEETPAFRNIYFKNVTSRNARRAMFFNGLPEMNISNINIEDVTVTAQYGAEFSESTDIHLKNVSIHPKSGAPLVLKNVKNFDVNNFTYTTNEAKAIQIEGQRTSNVKLSSEIKKEQVTISPQVNTDMVTW
ncbi:polygalacturonase [Breznakibacter xylanolyticus]|uniref:Polygalacturonase n=1 Tax=Breznakibacter xylanolyticus TaxID=990 RepID=A0A2W7NKB6_9BACT|nr:glycoside hydrolase family 28 protein [Breznakibacter xylanolyticus]PZX20718.1 polygalacturonase [Breznakibacter xylanolyticus]